MRILHVTPYYEHAWGYGGVPRVVGVLARAQVAAGHRVCVCTTDARDQRSRLAPEEACSQAHGGVEVHAFPNLSNRAAYDLQLFAPRGLGRWLQQNARRFEMVHVHGHHHLLGVLAARACARAGVSFVLSPHGTGPIIERRRAAKWLFDATVGRGVLARAHRVLCVSNSEAAALRRLGVGERLLKVVGNPLELRAFDVPPDAAAFRRRHGLEGSPVVAFLGRITPRKGVETLLRAMALLKDERARLVLAGNAPGMEASIERQVRSLRLQDRVLRLGGLEGPERFAVLAAADVVAYPARHEVFGLVAIESLLCGTPVVVADDSGCGELVRTLGGGLGVAPQDASALAQALGQVLEAPDSFREGARTAAGRVRESFSPAAVASRIAQVYAEQGSGSAA